MRKHEDDKPETCHWRSEIGIGAVILMLIVYTLTCYLIIDNYQGTVQSSETDAKVSEQSVLITREEEVPEDIPVPDAEYHVDWECGTYYSNITADTMESYLRELDRAGWKSLTGEEVSLYVARGTTSHQLLKEDTLLQLITFVEGEEVPLCNGILIRVDRGIRSEDLHGLVSTVEGNGILTKIQTVVDNMVKEKELPTARQKITGIFEIYIPDAYKKLELQAFAAVSDSGFIGCFLMRKGVVSYVEGNLANAIIADIDQDGGYELVDMYSTWEGGLFKHNLIAYEYGNPIFFSSLTEILLKKYSNCFVPEGEYEKLSLLKKGNKVRLIGEHADYGVVVVKDRFLVLHDMEQFPYAEWSTSYDQRLLLGIDKKLPKEPPTINITIDGIGIDYVVHKTSWAGVISEYTKETALEEILAKNAFLPKVFLGSFWTEAPEKTIVIDFGDSMPDSIRVADSILDDTGRQLYGEKLITEQTVKILDSSRVSFVLKQHISLYLSSNSSDYDRDWRRLFLITCRYGEKECVYALLINTGKNGQLTEVSSHDFLQCEGSYSRFSSSWGLGLSVRSERLPKSYIIEWQVNEGMIRSWNASAKKPIGIIEQHNNYPATYSWEDNRGDIIWNPISFEDSGEVTIRAVIYEDEKKKNPIAFDELTLMKVNETWQKKTEETLK